VRRTYSDAVRREVAAALLSALDGPLDALADDRIDDLAAAALELAASAPAPSEVDRLRAIAEVATRLGRYTRARSRSPRHAGERFSPTIPDFLPPEGLAP
jgi:hypothetical protein